MNVSPIVIFLSHPALFASFIKASSSEDFNVAMKPLELAMRKSRLANQVLLNRMEWNIKQFYLDVANGDMDEDDIETEKENLRQLKDQIAAEMGANEKECNEFQNKFWASTESIPDGYTTDYEIETLNKSLKIYQCPAIVILSQRSGGEFLTGYLVYDSARMLARYLEVTCYNGSWIRGKTVVELGAGTGYLGIVAACLGGNVTVTDLPAMIPFIQENIDRNSEHLKGSQGQIRTQVLRWGNAEDIKILPKADIILLSNLIYDDELLEPLVSTVVALSDMSTTLVVCQDKSSDIQIPTDNWDEFYRQISKHFRLHSIECNHVTSDGVVSYNDVWFMQGKPRKHMFITHSEL